MCTLSVVTRVDGYLLAMNRDERTSRGVAAPPEPVVSDGFKAVYPRDIEGGTWIGINESRMTLALINWYEVPPPVPLQKTRSRGLVIPELIILPSLQKIRPEILRLNMEGMLPFRLFGVFPVDQQIWEWTWDGARLFSELHPWKRSHWFSSSLSEVVQTYRSEVCRSVWTEKGAGSVAWLRKLHASHANGPGALSICVHGSNSRTVSYSEVICTADTVQLNYFPESPCLQPDEEIADTNPAAAPAGSENPMYGWSKYCLASRDMQPHPKTNSG